MNKKLVIHRMDRFDEDFNYFKQLENLRSVYFKEGLSNKVEEKIKDILNDFDLHIDRSLHRQLSFIFILVMNYNYSIDREFSKTQKDFKIDENEEYIAFNIHTKVGKEYFINPVNPSNGKYFLITDNNGNSIKDKFNNYNDLRIYKNWINKTISDNKKNIFELVILNSGRVLSGYKINNIEWFDNFKNILLKNEKCIKEYIIDGSNKENILEIIKDYIEIK